MTELLEIEDLRTEIRLRHATVHAVDGVSLSIGEGEIVGLVGESGCGKSMAALSIMRLLPGGGRIAGGSIRLAGRELTGLSPEEMRRVRGEEVAMVFQDPMTSLNPTMTIGEQIADPVRTHHKVSKKAAADRAAQVLGLVGMPRPRERMKAYPHELSGGLRQRAVIAMALSCEPRLLIADEPTTALDVTIQDQILALLEELKREFSMGMLLITHDMGVIAGHADRVMVMYAGQIAEAADALTVFGQPRHPYTEALLRSIPDLTTDKTKTLHSIPGLPPDLTAPPGGCRFAARCRYAQDRCRAEAPVLAGPGDHRYACFYPVEVAIGPAPGRDQARPAAAEAAASAGPARAPEPGEPLLVVDAVVKEFPIRKGVLQRKVGSIKAVSGVSLQVARGETFGLVGESGSGKTTLGRMIVALEKPDAGAVRFNGQLLSALRGAALRRRRRDLQMLFQDPYASLDPRMRVVSILREPLVAQHLASKPEQLERIRGLLSEVGLSPSAMRLFPHEFSGGQRQRLGLARALTLEPGLIVADEPVSALDVSIQSQVLNLMRRLQGDRALAYVVISHDLSVVRYLADRVGVMYLGKLVETGPADEVYTHPAHPYTAGLLEAVPDPDPVKERAKGTRAALRGELPSAADPPSGCRFRTRCLRAAEICATEEPALRAFNLVSHQAACHFPLQPPLADASAAGAGLPARSSEPEVPRP
jgi:peptide/nickel transport system ATP-binding protein